MKKLSLLLFVLNLTLFSQAQQVNYTILEDDPYAIKQLYIRINPFYVEGFRTNAASFGGGIELRYILKDRFVFNFNNWKSYSTIVENAANDKFVVRDLSAEYILSDKSKSGTIKITLSSSTSGSYTVSKYVEVPGTTRKVLAARGGIFNYKTPFKTSELKNIENIQLSNGNGGVTGFAPAGYLLKSTSIFTGISYSVINNTTISANGFGKAKGKGKCLNYYADVMFAPFVSTLNAAGEISDTIVERKRLGWRTGFVADFSTTKTITFSGRAEIGSRPGIKSNGFYLYCGLGMTVALLKNKTK